MTTGPNTPDHDGRPLCGGPKRQGEGTCGQTAGWGTDHPGIGRCKLHGGSTPSHKAAARRVQAEVAVATFGLPIAVGPHEALLEELHRTAGAVAWLGAVVGELDRGAVVWGRTRVKRGGDDHGVTREAKPNAWVELWHRERRHLVDVAKACVTAGIEERRVELEQARVRLQAEAVQAGLDAAGLSDDQRATVIRVMLDRLRVAAQVEAGGAA